MVAQTVVSVGPYALIIRRPADQRAAKVTGQASPATTRLASGSSSDKVATTAGGNVACVTCSAQISFARPSPLRSPPGRTSLAPDAKLAQISQTVASKLNGANCSNRASDVMASRSIWAAARLGMPRCVTATPFGVPVDPEV